MRFFNRLISKNFWYEVILNLTIWKTIKEATNLTTPEIKSIQQKYKHLKRMNKDFIKDIQSEYHVSWCSIILAIYQTCREKNISEENSISITENLIFSNMKAETIAGYVKKALDKAEDPFKYMVTSSKNQEKNFFGSTFRFYSILENENSYHLRVKDCLYNNFFKKNNAPELIEIACKWDIISWSLGIIPEKHKLELKRPITLGLDNKDCEFNFDRI